MIPAEGVDVSGHQTLERVRELTTDPKVGFVVVKATEGMHALNDDYAAQMELARQQEAKVAGAYHYGWPVQDPTVEAEHFVSTADLGPGEIAALDLERTADGDSWANRVMYALTWLRYVYAATGARPLIYLNWSWIKSLRTAATAAQWAELTSFPLWLADWSNVPGKHATVTSKDGTSQDSWPILIHQYGVVDGIDRDWTPNLTALRAIAVPAERS